MNQLETRWQQTQKLRSQLATEIKRLAKEVAGEESNRLKQIGGWLDRNHELADALQQPEILAITYPMFRDGHSDQITEQDIALIASNSLSVVASNPSTSRQAFRILRYPLALAAAFGTLWLFFIVWLAPEFRGLVEEFGITLPVLTASILGITPWLHRISWVVFAASIIVVAILAIRNLFEIRRPQSLSWLDRNLSSTRRSVAIWSRHVALLLQTGLSSLDSI